MRTSGARLLFGALVVAGTLGACPALAVTAPPANDLRVDAQVLSSLPASVDGTTVGATIDANEPASGCTGPQTASVWYSVTAPAKERVAVSLAAGGDLDATVDVYLAQRSQLQEVACDGTDAQGMAATSFTAAAGMTYLIRVAPLGNSAPGTFALDVFVPQKAAVPPGPALPPAGAGGTLDRIQDTTKAYSTVLKAGTSYRINLADETTGACVSAGLYPPGTSSFDDGSAVLRIHCGGYLLFTPTVGTSGRYSFLVNSSAGFSGSQHYYLQVAPAGPKDTAPGQFIGNYAKVSGRLDGNRVDALRLLRFDVVARSNLTLVLDAPQAESFDLKLLNEKGREISCECGDGGPETLNQQLKPGRFYAVVEANANSHGRFTLTRQSRTITTTRITIAGHRQGQAAPGQTVPIGVSVAPKAAGPVTVTIERFDPVSGWQYFRTDHLRASGGTAGAGFLPPASGRWRASASFDGTRSASPSASGFATLLVGGPLHQ
ncbi:MAG TPA: hypothetical protein VIJ51_11120 [Solirubrobacteraceae bacterium]